MQIIRCSTQHSYWWDSYNFTPKLIRHTVIKQSSLLSFYQLNFHLSSVNTPILLIALIYREDLSFSFIEIMEDYDINCLHFPPQPIKSQHPSSFFSFSIDEVALTPVSISPPMWIFLSLLCSLPSIFLNLFG